ncbi:MAG: hypothetical protein ABIJ97_00075 [Bacteroidota bacterium]
MDWTKEQLDAIWEKALFIDHENEKNGFRKDMCGAWIQRDVQGEVGNYGWQVDHIYPVSKAEDKGISADLYNNLINLQPLHHQNNGAEGKADDYPYFNSKIVANGNKNEEKVERNTIPSTKQEELKKLFGLNDL